MASDTNPPSRRGRLPAAEKAARQEAILDAAMAALVDDGYDSVTMLGIAKRAGASKETLYSWFGNRDGLIEALIERSADRSAERIAGALGRDAEPRAVLTGYATGLLTLLTSPGSIALNRAAMSSPGLADALLRSGRHRIGPLVERYLATLHDAGVLVIDEPAEAFELLYGLVIRDAQIRVLLGEPPPPTADIEQVAATAVDRFLTLVAPD